MKFQSKTMLNLFDTILTLAELETLASLGLTGFLALYGTWVASHETLLAQGALVLGIDLHQGASDSQAQSLGLSLVTTTNQVNLDVVLLGCLESGEGLLNDELKNWRWKIFFKFTLVDCDFAISLANVYTCTRAIAALRRPTALICSILPIDYLSLLISITLGC